MTTGKTADGSERQHPGQGGLELQPVSLGSLKGGLNESSNLSDLMVSNHANRNLEGAGGVRSHRACRKEVRPLTCTTDWQLEVPSQDNIYTTRDLRQRCTKYQELVDKSWRKGWKTCCELWRSAANDLQGGHSAKCSRCRASPKRQREMPPCRRLKVQRRTQGGYG